jgi:hypothetical protein
MKTRMILIGLILFLWINSGLAGAATLFDTRAGDHNNFTRIVFEFKNFVQFIQPVIKKDGKLSVVFPNTTTLLPDEIVYRETSKVDEIQLYQRDSHLAVNIALSVPNFEIKSYLLSNPERFVIDVYWMQTTPIEKPLPPKIAFLEKAAVFEKTEEVEDKERGIEKTDEVEDKEQGVEKTDAVESPEPVVKKITGIVKGSAIQPIEKVSIFSSSYSFLQTFFLAGLNHFTLVIIVLLCLILFRQIRVIDSAHLEYVPEPRRAPDDPITTIDEKIRQVLGGMGSLEEWR